MKKILISIWLLSTTLPLLSWAQPTIDFEGYFDSEPVGSIGIISFSSAIIATAGATLNEFEAPPHSGYSVALSTDSTMTLLVGGPITQIAGFITYAEPVVIEAFGKSGLLGSRETLFGSNLMLSGDQGSKPNEEFSLSFNELITSITLSSENPGAFAIDDLLFSDTRPSSYVAEPNLIYLLLSGLLALAFKTKNRNRTRQNIAILLAIFTIKPALSQNLEKPDIYPQTIPLGSAVTVTVTAVINDPKYIVGSAILNEISIDGRILRQLASFNDMGVDGDEVSGDHLYTARFSTKENVTRSIFLSLSIATQGALSRSTSPPTVLWAAADADLRMGYAVATQSSISFRDSTGRLISRLKLSKNEEKQTSLPRGTGIRTTNDTAFSSENQSRAGIISQSTVTVLGEDEGSSEPSTFRLYGPSGVLLFTRNAPNGTTFFVDDNNQYLSRSGSRVVLVEKPDDPTLPQKIILLSDSGSLLYSTSDLPGVGEISHAKISSSGRYIGIIGIAIGPSSNVTSVFVIDTSSGLISSRYYDLTTVPSVAIAENLAGKMSIIINGTVGETLP